jgi:hypothetical protein
MHYDDVSDDASSAGDKYPYLCRSIEFIISGFKIGHRRKMLHTLLYTYKTDVEKKVACYKAIQDTCHLVEVSHLALGLKALPKGWCWGNIKLMDRTSIPQWNGESYLGAQGFLTSQSGWNYQRSMDSVWWIHLIRLCPLNA